MSAEPRPFAPVAGGLRLAVRLTPGAGREAIDGVVADACGGAVLRVSVTAPPEGGKANAALIKLLAKRWRLPRSSLAVVRGAKGRRKTLHLAGDGPALAARLERWLKETP